MPPTRPRKFGRGSCGILGTTCTSLPRTVPGSTRWSAGSPYCHNARSNEVRTTACVNWNLPSWSSSRCTTSSPNPLCGPRVPMPFSIALDGSLPVLWPHTAQTICKKSVTQETSVASRTEGPKANYIRRGRKRCKEPPPRADNTSTQRRKKRAAYTADYDHGLRLSKVRKPIRVENIDHDDDRKQDAEESEPT